ESALRRFINDKTLPWPQHFDGKGWENKFALHYGIFSIPTMWLVDKRGNLRETDVRFDLEEPIKSLLDEQESPAPELARANRNESCLIYARRHSAFNSLKQ